MIDENQPEIKEDETHEPLLDQEAQKKLLYGAAVLLLMAGSFVAGRYSVQKAAPPPNPFTQMPTPLVMDTPTPVGESAFTMINFSGVSAAKKAEVLAKFNSEPCGCNCRMTVASCIIKDPNCPLWKDHITQFQKALGNGKKPNLTQVPVGKPAGEFPTGMTGALPAPKSLPSAQSLGK
jgi:hypothetical protein